MTDKYKGRPPWSGCYVTFSPEETEHRSLLAENKRLREALEYLLEESYELHTKVGEYEKYSGDSNPTEAQERARYLIKQRKEQ